VKHPKTRGDCLEQTRPCPFVTCHFHLFLIFSTRGVTKAAWWNRDPLKMDHSCALDLADRGGMTLEEIGDIIGLTRERIRQIERIALPKLHNGLRALGVGREALKPDVYKWKADRQTRTPEDA